MIWVLDFTLYKQQQKYVPYISGFHSRQHVQETVESDLADRAKSGWQQFQLRVAHVHFRHAEFASL